MRGITSALEESAADYALRSRGPATRDHRALDREREREEEDGEWSGGAAIGDRGGVNGSSAM